MSGDTAAVRYVTVGSDRDGQRLDNFLLACLKGVPRSHVYRLLRSGQVRVNGRRARPAQRLAAGDQVRLPPVRQGTPAPAPDADRLQPLLQDLRRRVVYEDADLLVLDKPAGLAVHGGSGRPWGLIEAVKAAGGEWAGVELAHRLDRHTSGCLLLVKHRAALAAVHAALREGAVEKRYLALLAGDVRRPRRVTVALRRHGGPGPRRVTADTEGKPAVSHIEPLRRWGWATLVAVRIETGRTHQIRVHCAKIGHPVAGDERYGDRAFDRRLRAHGLRRLFLHAGRLALVWGGQRRVFEAPLPAELAEVLEALDADAQA